MKMLMVVLAMSLFFLSCEKEKVEYAYNISGRIIDADTKEPIPGVDLYVDEVYINLEYGLYYGLEILDDAVTDSNGRFFMNFNPDDSDPGSFYSHEISLKIHEVPGGCQSPAIVNGIASSAIFENISKVDWHAGYQPLENNGFYLIELKR